MEYINTTNHDINIKIGNDTFVRIAKSESQLRIDSKLIQKNTDGLIPIFEHEVYNPGDMPKVKNNTAYIVSKVIKQHFPERDDFYVPIGVTTTPEGYTYCKGLTH